MKMQDTVQPSANTQTNTVSLSAPSRQVRRQMERRQIKNMKRHMNETVHGKNRKR